MRYAQYLKAEGHITAADSGSIIERWRYGRRLLCDEAAMTASKKSLKHGVLDRLIVHANAKGYDLTEREVQYRIQCGRAYPTEAQIRTVSSDFASWTDLRKAGFPERERPTDEPDYDPRWTDERERDAAQRSAVLFPEEDEEQLALFPDDRFDELSTLEELSKYADEMVKITERFARRDTKRLAYLRRLIDAVHGDLSATWAEARAALGESGGA